MQQTNGKRRLNFSVTVQLLELLDRIVGADRLKNMGRKVNRHTVLRDALQLYARRKHRDLIPRGL